MFKKNYKVCKKNKGGSFTEEIIETIPEEAWAHQI